MARSWNRNSFSASWLIFLARRLSAGLESTSVSIGSSLQVEERTAENKSLRALRDGAAQHGKDGALAGAVAFMAAAGGDAALESQATLRVIEQHLPGIMDTEPASLD